METRTLLSRRASSLLIAVWIVVLAGCGTMPPPKSGTAATGDKLNVGDLISVKIQGVQDPPTYEGPIDENGEFQMLYFGKIKAAGLTENELEERIKYLSVQLGIYPPRVLQDMIVTVTVATRFYYITGEAARGRVPLAGGLTVCRALLASGGTGEFADLKKIIVHRGTQKIRVNCIRAGNDPRYDTELKSGDIIEVPKKGILPF